MNNLDYLECEIESLEEKLIFAKIALNAEKNKHNVYLAIDGDLHLCVTSEARIDDRKITSLMSEIKSSLSKYIKPELITFVEGDL
jgi:hypothetical protein